MQPTLGSVTVMWKILGMASRATMTTTVSSSPLLKGRPTGAGVLASSEEEGVADVSRSREPSSRREKIE